MASITLHTGRRCWALLWAMRGLCGVLRLAVATDRRCRPRAGSGQPGAANDASHGASHTAPLHAAGRQHCHLGLPDGRARPTLAVRYDLGTICGPQAVAQHSRYRPRDDYPFQCSRAQLWAAIQRSERQFHGAQQWASAICPSAQSRRSGRRRFDVELLPTPMLYKSALDLSDRVR
jgi:hypothetical protein